MVAVSPKCHIMDRLRAQWEFRRVYDEGRRHAAGLLVLYRLALAGPARVGIAVGRRVGTAVVRNRVRRRIREILRRAPLSAGQQVVIVARPQAGAASFGALRSEIEALLRTSGALGDCAEVHDGRPGGRSVARG